MDNLTPDQRSRTMSLIRSKDTQPELTIRRLLHARGLRFRKHGAWLPVGISVKWNRESGIPDSEHAVQRNQRFMHKLHYT